MFNKFFGRGHLEQQNAMLTERLAEALRESQALNAKLADGLDRVLEARFDKPLMPNPTQQPKREPMFPDLGDLLSTEDDGEFVERMSALEGTLQ